MADKDNTQTEDSKKGTAASGDAPVVHNVEMFKTPQVAPDGHVNLSEEDIKNRA